MAIFAELRRLEVGDPHAEVGAVDLWPIPGRAEQQQDAARPPATV